MNLRFLFPALGSLSLLSAMAEEAGGASPSRFGQEIRKTIG
jgi:hypothetical protein